MNLFEYLKIQPEFIVLTEITQKQSSVLNKIEGYKEFFTQRTKKGKWVAISIANSISSFGIKTSLKLCFDNLVIEVCLGNSKFRIIAVYNLLKNQVNKFPDDLASLFEFDENFFRQLIL